MFDPSLASSSWLLSHLSSLTPYSTADLATALPFAALFTGRSTGDASVAQGLRIRAAQEAAEAVKRDSQERFRAVATIAVDRADLEAAACLVEERYAWRGYGTEHLRAPSQTRREVTLLARSGERAVGTMTLGFDSKAGLYVDQTYPDELLAARSEGCNACELTRLAVAERADTKATFSAMFNLAYVIARRMLAVTDAFVEVNPRHAAFYRRAFGFLVASEERICERVKAPAVLLRLRLETLEAQMLAIGAALPGAIEFAPERA